MTTQDLFSIKGKTACVTGGSRGIGLMIARGFVEAGAKVYISSRKKEQCDATAAELSKTGECISVPADLSGLEGIGHLVDAVQQKESELHILVNNAGAAWGEPIETYPESGWDKTMDTNVKAIFFLTREMLPLLRKGAAEEDPARVINISSIEAFKVPAWENYAYSASKAAVIQLTRHMARRLADDRITVNAIAPGLFPSRMTKFVFDNEGTVEAFKNTVPMGREGRADDIAGPAIFLASKAANYMTGSFVTVDGGALVS
ncbi:MAG TPA: SDR family oxidoreductase [Actinomycetota bacterium]|nr:SDR family oxidoreductase [Actinomycetota bacterium]